MTTATHAKIPPHLRRYIVDQNYARYTPEDQAAWRYILRQLRQFLGTHAHPIYLEGLAKSGITVDRIPAIADIDRALEPHGWGAVPVSGFIPPAAFMEFQALGILPIASDMRTVGHLEYTPAPDIVHEAAGHAPILLDAEYAAYLRQYGEVARRAIISKEDLDQYEAIRILSDIKEDPRSTPSEIALAEKRLAEVNATIQGVSEAALLSRMNWWTAEYGLIGDVGAPKIFGAGLLSSVGESRHCLEPTVKKIPLSVACVDYTYDITEPQPQLFVATDFAHLSEVLEQLASRLAYRRGGRYALERAREARTTTTTLLNSGLQISGTLKDFVLGENGDVAYVQWDGPTQLAFAGTELRGQGSQRHAHGYSTPLGFLRDERRCLSTFSPTDLERIGARNGQRLRLEYTSGVVVTGELIQRVFEGPRLLLLTFKDARVTLGDRVLFDPSWGEYDVAVGSAAESVYSGPADRAAFGERDDFATKHVPMRQTTPAERQRHDFYASIRALRESSLNGSEATRRFDNLVASFLRGADGEWLPGIELLELTYTLAALSEERRSAARLELLTRLDPRGFTNPVVQQSIRDGIDLARKPS